MQVKHRTNKDVRAWILDHEADISLNIISDTRDSIAHCMDDRLEDPIPTAKLDDVLQRVDRDVQHRRVC